MDTDLDRHRLYIIRHDSSMAIHQNGVPLIGYHLLRPLPHRKSISQVQVTCLTDQMALLGYPYPRYKAVAISTSTSTLESCSLIHPSAEWAIARLQVQGSRLNAEHPDIETNVQVSYTCSSKNHSGKLVVTSKGVRFDSFGLPHHEWNVPYNRMYRVEKNRQHLPPFAFGSYFLKSANDMLWMC